jgi:hypothetical protein
MIEMVEAMAKDPGHLVEVRLKEIRDSLTERLTAARRWSPARQRRGISLGREHTETTGSACAAGSSAGDESSCFSTKSHRREHPVASLEHTMRPSKYRSFSFARGFAMPFTERAIDPNNLEFMRAAFNKACERLGLQCRREDRITDVVVDTIIEIAATGERDPDRVCELVLVHLKESERDVA